MGRIFRRMPSPAMVVACIALAVALGGTSYAAITLPRNSVGTLQLRNNSITANKLGKYSVGPAKLKANSVGPAKLKLNAVTGAKVKANSLTGANIDEATLEQVPSAAKANDPTTVGGYAVRRFAITVAPGGAEASVLNINGLVITLACPGGSVALRGNNNSGEAAQLRFEGYAAGTAFGGGSANFLPTSNENLNNSANEGSGSAHYVRANGTGVTALYGWGADALGTSIACRVFGQAISG
jgi:hypothetical protein